MKYNFYIYIVLLSVISAGIGFLYKNILKDCSILQEVFITNIILIFYPVHIVIIMKIMVYLIN